MLYGNNQNPLFSTGGGIGRPLGQTLPPLQQQQQQPQQIPAPGWALQPQNQSAPAPKPAQQPHTAFIQYSNSHRQLPIPCTRQDNQLPQGFVQTIPITSSHQQHPQHSQQASLHHGWMDAPGTSTAYSITTIPTTSNGLTTHNANGTLPSGFSQFSSSGFNGQIVTALTTANGIMPSTSIPSSNSTGVTAPTPQSIQPAVVGAVKQTKELEDYYIAERARQNVQSIAAAASQIYGQASGGQKLPKLEGLPAGVIPAGGIRKPKQGRPRADVAQPGGGASTSAASAAAGGATVKSELSPTPTTSNGTGRSRPESGATGGEIVNYLMGFNIQVAEADFSSKALESLHKKIKDRPHDLETFMRAVETKGEVIGNCITVTRTLDGRLQVAGRKGFPHVIYAKIFRFQELHKNELKSIPQCIYGFDNKAENEEHKPDAQVCVNPYHYERVTAPSGGGNLIDPLTGLLRANALQSMDEMMDFASSSMKMTTPDFLQSRPSMLSNPPAQGGFGFTSFDAKAVTDKAGSSQEKPSSALSDEFLKMAAGLSKGDAEQLNELIEHIKRYSVAEKLAMAPDTSDEAHESESDQTNDEAIEVHPSLSLVARKNFAFDKLLLENSKEKARLDEMKKEKEEEDAERIPTDDPDWPEEMMERQKKAQELAEHERRFKKGEERLANMMMARDQDFANIEDATIWNSQYNDDSGRPCFFRKNHIVGLPPNNKVVVGETGSGTFGSKGPHRKPQQLFSKELEWSLQQVVKMLATCALDGNISTTQYMLCCQHYAGMMKKTAGAQSLDPEQVKLCKAALESVKEAAGGVVTTQQLHSWDLSRLFANHLKTRPQRGEEQLARRNAACALNREWTFEINQEMDKFVAETKGTDAEGIFSKKQIERALAARQRLVRGEKLVPDELMAVEELRREKDSRKRGRAEAGLDHEMEAIDLNSMGMSVEEQGQEEDFDPILPVLENAFTSDDLNALFETPNEYLRTFRDHVFGDATVNTYQEEMDISLRGTVPPPEGDERFQPFDGRERENDEPDENGEERPPLKRNCLCPEAEKKDHCFWGKHHHYMHGVSREIVDAAFLLYRYRIQRKKSSGPRGELYNFATQFDCPKVCLKRAMEIEPHSAKLKPPNYHWCAVNYCERDNHVGSMRQVEAVNFFIDGGFESVHEQRYCISSVSHPLTRFDKQVNDVRSRIGCGVRISVKEDGSMWVRVLSRYPVFISSTFLDREAGLVNGDAIHKIYPGSSIKAFDLVRARRAILQMYEYQKEAYKLHNGEKKLESMPYPLNTFNRRELRSISRIGGDDLHKHAVVKIGFIKGWGPEFEYKKICETPCWVEIINNRACEFIDHIMNLREVCYAFSEHDSSDYE
ncbi:hypothetical protein PMAYCL1PPCAC_33192 [Pristionchus mayeri]|uniref:Mothers against decapentaplegic homolog n=1 Tax=Pristionchus mayeri TaxID=1317129 RepID=A0AAN5IE38_9BILA|nr:hypothetical protein PMAYCL1PPCAC_33192 [Pristionchus mayeri]